MPLRITNNVLQSVVVNGLFRNARRLRDLQEDVSSGNQISRPSDDPIGTTDIFSFNTDLSRNAQFLRNVDRGVSFLQRSESALNDVVHILTRARELAIAEASGTASATTRAGAAIEVTNLRDQLLALANASDGERFLFGGFTTDRDPFDVNGTFQGDTGDLQIQVSERIFVTINLRGDQAFEGSAGGVNILQTLNNLATALNGNDSGGVFQQIGNLETATEQINFQLATAGARLNQLETVGRQLGEEELNVRKNLSEVRDTDFAEAATELTNQETLFRASLAAAASLLRTSLLDFLA